MGFVPVAPCGSGPPDGSGQTSSHRKTISPRAGKNCISSLLGACPGTPSHHCLNLIRCPPQRSIPVGDCVTCNPCQSSHHRWGDWTSGMSHEGHGFAIKEGSASPCVLHRPPTKGRNGTIPSAQRGSNWNGRGNGPIPFPPSSLSVLTVTQL